MQVLVGYDDEGNPIWEEQDEDSYNFDYGYDTTPEQGSAGAWANWVNSPEYNQYVENTNTANTEWITGNAPNSGYIGTGSSPASGGGTTPVEGPTGVTPTNTSTTDWVGSVLAGMKKWAGYDDKADMFTNAMNFLKSDAGKVLAGGVGAAIGYNSAAKPSGGGITKRYVGPAQQLTRTVEQDRYGPVAKFTQTAADGGVMHAYKHGGQVAMEDGGFVMTKRAVDGAGGPQGIQRLVPGARPIRGPGTGTSDSIPAYIQGPRGRTPAAVSNGEAYVPRQTVQQNGGPQRMYALMNQLQRRRG